MSSDTARVILIALGVSILVVDKDIRALIPLAQRHYVIHKGEICWSGTSEQLERSRAELDRYITL